MGRDGDPEATRAVWLSRRPPINQPLVAYDVRYRELGYAVGDSSDEACLDERTKRALENKHMAFAADNGNPEDILEFFQDVEYILGTGRNWKGPIGQFTLRIVKETPDTIVSLCFPGKPKKLRGEWLSRWPHCDRGGPPFKD